MILLSNIVTAIADRLKTSYPLAQVFSEQVSVTGEQECFFIGIEQVKADIVLFDRRKYVCSFDLTCLAPKIDPTEKNGLDLYCFGAKVMDLLEYITVDGDVLRLQNRCMKRKNAERRIQGMTMHGESELHIYFDIELFAAQDDNVFEQMERLDMEVANGNIY